MTALFVLVVVTCVALVWRRRSFPVLALGWVAALVCVSVGAVVIVEALAVAAGVALAVTWGHARYQVFGTPAPVVDSLPVPAVPLPMDWGSVEPVGPIFARRLDLHAIATEARKLADLEGIGK